MYFPQALITVTPHLLRRGITQYTIAENNDRVPLCQLRYVSEAYFSRFYLKFKILRDGIPRSEFNKIGAAISMAHGDSNLRRPLKPPECYATYFKKYYPDREISENEMWENVTLVNLVN